MTFEEALNAILRVNGYGYVEEGNFIYATRPSRSPRSRPVARSKPESSSSTI